MTSASQDEIESTSLAVAVLKDGVEALPKEKRFRHAGLGLFTDDEVKHLGNLTTLMTQYLERSDPPRPLCLAVFGAPGSGKSRLVRELPKLMGSVGKKLARLDEINVTQATSIDSLAAALDNAGKAAEGKVPFIFFDEFDAKRDGAPWGWLSWFLAPMQDGVFFHQGERRGLKRAIYVFAGGTSSSYEGFGQADRDAFRAAKGPDFVSRLRGYLNIPGVNADGERLYRRAAVLYHLLDKHKKAVDGSLRTALLNVGRYKHGARSVEAVIELMPRKVSAVTVKDLRSHPLLKMHVDRGPLDASAIGGWIGISGSDLEAEKPDYQKVWGAIGDALFRDGATLACGGRHHRPKGLMAKLQSIVKKLPERLEPTRKPPTQEPWIVVARSEKPPKDPRVQVLPSPAGQPGDFLPKLGSDQKPPLTDALEMFRMRYQLSLGSVARFAIGGRLDKPHSSKGAKKPSEYKRYPGIAEELMLALAMKRPIYVSGALHGAARWVGVLLGLGRTWSGRRTGFDQDWLEVPVPSAPLFRPPPFTNLPRTREDLINFFQAHALGGPLWVKNGLTDEENRQLFELGDPELKPDGEPFTATDAEQIAALVRRGLRTLFAPHTL